MAGRFVTKGSKPKVSERVIRTRDLEVLLHLSKTEMKHIEAIARIVQLDSQYRQSKSPTVREQRSRALYELRQYLSGARVDKILDRICNLNSSSGEGGGEDFVA